MVIQIRSLVPGADTADQGLVIYQHLSDALRGAEHVVVSFDGLQTATSSFVKTAFVELLKSMSFTDLKARMKVINSTRQINQMIKTRLEREALQDA